MPHWVVGRNPRRTVVRALLLALCGYALFTHVLRPVRVRGVSMEPTLRNGSFHVASLVRYARDEPRRGDVILVALAGRRAYYVKRVIGLPGETVAFDAGRLVVDGATLAEPYLASTGRWTMAPLTIEAGCLFVAGDNRAIPLEDHLAGIVRRERIAGGLLF